MNKLTFDAPEKSVEILNEIAAERNVDRADILREALALYLEDYADLQADLEEADRQIEAGRIRYA